ncbi:MAG: hypothetical protein WC518_02350 [Patescibacteria group bacterium]
MNQHKALPTLHVVGESIPQAYFRAIKAVWEQGLAMRTQYDRKNDAGEFIDPPSRDARMLIEIKDPFAQPRFPPISFCEIGVYIAEILGVKNHRVLPMSVLLDMIDGRPVPEELRNHWPYTYHQRLTAHPESDGRVVNQLNIAIGDVAKVPYTRRAMCTTSVPNIDPFLKEDVPCLRELQLRCVEQDDGLLLLCPTTTWRSRDLYKAWGDNVIAITFLLQTVAKEIAQRSGRRVKLGSYADFSMSLHIYGQDFGAVGGDQTRGIQSFFDTFDEKAFIARSLTSEMATEMLVLPQLQELLTPGKQQEWGFPKSAAKGIQSLIDEIKSGTLLA